MFRSRLAWIYHAACLFFVLCCIPASGQTSFSVSGCVVDPSHSRIPGASVSLTSSDQSEHFQSQTDEKGCFSVGVRPGKYQLRVLAAGFSSFEKTLAVENPAPMDDIVLQVRGVEETAVVTATRSLASTNSVAASVDVIDRDQIDASHIDMAADLLRSVAGASVVQTGNPGGITSLFLRGGNSNHTKFLIDGIPINQPGGPYDFAHIPTDDIGRMELVRGPQSALYGSDALTGVVQMFTRRGTGSPEGDYSIEGGNYGTLKETAGLQGAWRRLDWANTFSRLDTDNIQPNNDYRNASYFGSFGLTPDSRQSLRGTLFHISSRAGSPGDDAPGFISFAPNAYATDLERAAGLTYQVLAGSRATQHFAYNYYDHDYQYFSDGTVSPLAHNRNHIEYHGDVAVPVTGTLSYGIDYDRESGTIDSALHVRNNTGFYAQDQFERWNRLNVTAGVRFEKNTTFGTSTNPNLGVSFRVEPNTRLRFSAGTGITEPTYTENFSQNAYFLGNISLVPERSRSWETGIEHSFLSNRVTADLTWFDNTFHNWIQLVTNPDFTGQYQNIGEIRARGLETRIRARARKLAVQGNYAYLDGFIQQSSEDSFPYAPGDPLIRRPKHSGDLTLTWTERKWTAQWATRAIGRRADSDFFAYNAAPDSLTSNAGYSISDASFSYDFARPVSAFIRVGNIFDRNYQEVLGYLALRRTVIVGTRIRIGGAR